jgi:hypothetical protein
VGAAAAEILFVIPSRSVAGWTVFGGLAEGEVALKSVARGGVDLEEVIESPGASLASVSMTV